MPVNERPWRALWEYARSSPGSWVEKAVKDWFKRKLKDGSTIRKLFLQSSESDPNSRLTDAFDLRPPELKRRPTGTLLIEKGGVKLEGEFDKGDFDLRPISRFCKLLRHLPFFPKPWQEIRASLRVKAIKRLADRHIVASGRPIPPLSIYGEDDWAFWWEEFQPPAPSFDGYILNIDWENYDRKAIVREFERWLSAEAEKRLKDRRKEAHKVPSPDQRLKYLCAFRLRQAGLVFADVQKRLRAFPRDADTLAVLPLHARPDHFSRDARAAEAYAAELFPPPQ